MKIATFLCLVLLFFSSLLYAANISIDMNGDWILLEGDITDGDLEKIIEKSKHLNSVRKKIEIRLLSKGGDFIEAMKIGRFVRNVGAETILISGMSGPGGIDVQGYHIDPGYCYSSCFAVFVAGVIRDYTENNKIVKRNNRNEPPIVLGEYPVIGIHRPYYDKKYFSEIDLLLAKKEYDQLDKTTRQYFYDMGIPSTVVDKMFSINSEEIYLMPAKEFNETISRNPPFFREWIVTKCANEKPLNLAEFSESFKNQSKYWDWIDYDCQKVELLKHQDEILKQY